MFLCVVRVLCRACVLLPLGSRLGGRVGGYREDDEAMTAAHMGSPMIAQLGRGRRHAARAPLLPFLALLLAGLAGAAAVALPSPLALRGAVAASPAAAEQGLGRGSEDFGHAEWLGRCQKVSQTRHEESYGRISRERRCGRISRERRFRDSMRLSSISDVCVVRVCVVLLGLLPLRFCWRPGGLWRPTRCCMRRTVGEARG